MLGLPVPRLSFCAGWQRAERPRHHSAQTVAELDGPAERRSYGEGGRIMAAHKKSTKKKAGGNVKNKKQYKALKRKGMSKTRAAKIAISGKAGSRKGGGNSHKYD